MTTSSRVRSVFVASTDPQRILAFRHHVKPTHWIVPYSEAMWSTFARLQWVSEEVPPYLNTLQGIYPMDSALGEILWLNYPDEGIGTRLGYKVDWILVDGKSNLTSLRALTTPNTCLFGWSQGAMPAYVEEMVPTPEGWRLGRFRGTQSSPIVVPPSRVAIVGGGIAGAFCAYALSLRGISPLLIDRGVVPASEASALFAGLIHPHWQQTDSPFFKLTRAGYVYTLNLLAREPFRSRWGKPQSASLIESEVTRIHPPLYEPIGVFDMATDEAEWCRWAEAYARDKPFAMPKRLAQLFDTEQAQAQTGLPVARGGWWFPEAGLVYASRLARALIEASGAQVLTNTEVRLERHGDAWSLCNAAGESLAEVSDVILASARETRSLLGLPMSHLPLMGLKGRISLVMDAPLPEQRIALTGTGYLMKLPGELTAMGATYEPLDKAPWSELEAHEHNASLFRSLLPQHSDYSPLWGGFYEGVRAVTTDRMPVVGRAFMPKTLEHLAFKGVPELERLSYEKGLWVMAGLGSRGLTWGAICAEICVRQLLGEPPIVEASLRRALHPHRFVRAMLGEFVSGS